MSLPSATIPAGERDGRVAPFGPVFLAGLLLRPLPPAMLQPLLDGAMRAVLRRHPRLVGRLGAFASTTFAIAPDDLPFRFLLRPGPPAPFLRAVPAGVAPPAAATIRGPFLALLDLLSGNGDGDALFFARDLAIEGDTEAVLALRNALDAEAIDLAADLAEAVGPLGAPARRVAGLGLATFERARADLEAVRTALLAPTTRRADGMAARLAELERRLAALERRPPRAGTSS
jgi:predicted lipid carrier protein YhbT